MTAVRVPTPLRPYTGGVKEVQVDGRTVGAAILDLTLRYPDLRRHLYDETGRLRPFVNVFVNDDDARNLQGEATPLVDGDRLMIVPSIAGGRGPSSQAQALRPVDHAALRLNQAMIIGLLAAAFVAGAPWLSGFVALVMLAGTLLSAPGFLVVYRLLRRFKLLQPDVLRDNPQPHRFAQGFGGVVLIAGAAAFVLGYPAVGWAAAGLVAALAALNLFADFCLGCAVYYWLQRLGAPGFSVAPPPHTLPGRRPPAAGA